MSRHPESLEEGEKRHLLEIARAALQRAARERQLYAPPSPPESNCRLLAPRAVFVSLHVEDRLRGCIGQLTPRHPLYRAVAEAAFCAAREDPRFPPVEPEEVPQIQIEISVLSPFAPIRPEEIVPGIHGLVVSRDRARGLLLPQVATHYGWDAQRLLEETCRKAGLERDAWKHGASVQAFTAEVFGEAYCNSTNAPA